MDMHGAALLQGRRGFKQVTAKIIVREEVQELGEKSRRIFLNSLSFLAPASMCYGILQAFHTHVSSYQCSKEEEAVNVLHLYLQDGSHEDRQASQNKHKSSSDSLFPETKIQRPSI